MPSSYTIGEHYEKFVRDLVASGRYASASEVIRDALRLLEECENACGPSGRMSCAAKSAKGFEAVSRKPGTWRTSSARVVVF